MYLVLIDKFSALIGRKKDVSFIARFAKNRCKISGIMTASSKGSADASDLSPKKKLTKCIRYQEYRYEYGKELHRKLQFFWTHDLDMHGFSRHRGGAFSGIMPSILYRQGRKAPLLHT